MTIRLISFGAWYALLLALLALPQALWAHVTLQSGQPLRPGRSANITLNVPNERHVDNTKVTLEVPEAFLNAGGRLNRLIYPAGWTVTLEKKDKPSDIYSKESEERARRDAERQEAAAEHGTPVPERSPEEQEALDEMRSKWITKVTFEGGTIPPDGFGQFTISFQLPDDEGRYRFPAVQTYADGQEVSWSELVEGAERPAPSLNIANAPMVSYSDLPVPLSALALLIAAIALFLGVRAPKQAAVKQSMGATGQQLASVGGHSGD